MRLLNVKTHQLEDAIVTDTKFPPYSILSHTWGQEEVSFQDLTKGDELLQQLAGYTKILGCCAKSASEGFEHTWIDTCCIDKSSSAELSEAINSMFRWYSKAQVCYAYLSDVDGIGEDSPEKDGSSFRRSRWFTRGWTLQELLAPVEVVFLNRDWEEIGTKSSLASVIASFTRIDAGALKKPLCGSEAVSHHCAGYSIAQKMCWAAWRKTTREEDRAYSLMGLFGVNMPLLYGEGGEKAFARLQSQIMEQSSDDSIFAWSRPGWIGETGIDGDRCGLLAWCPELFYSGFAIHTAYSESQGLENGTHAFSASQKPISTSFEKTKDFILLTAPIINLLEHSHLVIRESVVSLMERYYNYYENPEPESGAWLTLSRFKQLDDIYSFLEGDHSFLDDYEPDDTRTIAILGCRSQYGHVGIVLNRNEDGTYIKESGPQIQKPQVAQLVALQLSGLPASSQIRIHHTVASSSINSCSPRRRGLPFAGQRDLDVILTDGSGYCMVRKYIHYPRDKKLPPESVSHPEMETFPSYNFVPFIGGLAFLFARKQDGGNINTPGAFALAFHLHSGTVAVQGFDVSEEIAAAHRNWTRGLEWDSTTAARWDEVTTGETKRVDGLAGNKHVDVRLRYGPGKGNDGLHCYLLVSVRSIEG